MNAPEWIHIDARVEQTALRSFARIVEMRDGRVTIEWERDGHRVRDLSVALIVQRWRPAPPDQSLEDWLRECAGDVKDAVRTATLVRAFTRRMKSRRAWPAVVETFAWALRRPRKAFAALERAAADATAKGVVAERLRARAANEEWRRRN